VDAETDSNAILRQYGNLVYRLALLQVKKPVDADDVFQDVFLRLVLKQRKFESDEHIKAWLIRVTINRCNSFWKSAWKQKVVSLQTEVNTEENIEFSEVYEQVLALPKKYKTVIHLFYYEDMPIGEMSKILNLGYNATAKRLSRARNLLKQQMMGDADNEF